MLYWNPFVHLCHCTQTNTIVPLNNEFETKLCATVQCQPMCGWRILVKHEKLCNSISCWKLLNSHYIIYARTEQNRKLFRNIQVQRFANQTGIQISQLNRKTTHKTNLFPRHQFIIDVDSNNLKVFSFPRWKLTISHWAKEMSDIFWPNFIPFRSRSTFSTSITGAVR